MRRLFHSSEPRALPTFLLFSLVGCASLSFAQNTISTFAGTNPFFPTGIPATSAPVGAIEGIAFDSSFNPIFSDATHNQVWKLSSGTLTLIAGNGTAGFSGDGQAATAAQLNNPVGLATDSAGNLYIADSGNNRIRKVDVHGVITTYAGNGYTGLAGDARGQPELGELFSDIGRVPHLSNVPRGTILI
jgi:hypothetical protein